MVEIKRKKTKEVNIGDLKIGGDNPIRIKAMIKTSSDKPKKLIQEAKILSKEGAEALRLAIRDEKDLEIISFLKKIVSLPLVADIHFNYKLALLAIEKGFSAIRLNPLNIYQKKEVLSVIRKAKDFNLSIRIGINSGGFRQKFKDEKELANLMVQRVEDYLELFKKENFSKIMVSLKGADVKSTILAYQIFSKKHPYPLHLGITATGDFLEGTIKSSLGLGVLLYEGIGDVIRVSLNAPSFWEVRVAKFILQFLNLRRFCPEIIACPMCGRCQVNLMKIVDNLKKEIKLREINKPLKIAVMGCVVNGPGEASQADIGVAFGGERAVIFKGNKIIGRGKENDIIELLIKKIKEIWT